MKPMIKYLALNTINFKTIKVNPILLVVLFLSLGFGVFGQDLYVKTFGNPSSTPIIYLHGGPGYNCASFEVTTGQILADAGFYVVAYDRRGEGRSDTKAKFNFKQSHADLIAIMDSLKIESANFIGHSFGGMVAITLAEKFPNRIESIILVGAPVSLQESFKNIISVCEKIYVEKEDKTNLSYIKMLKGMDSSSVQYSSFCFMHAMQNGFYSPKKPSPEAMSLYKLFRSDSTLMIYGSKMGYNQPQGFWKNEGYTTLNLSSNIKNLVEKKVKIVGIYGKEDGLYSNAQVMDLKASLGENNLLYLDDCSHSVFIDQQKLFIQALVNWTK